MPLNYWSCSKFADWIRGTPRPKSGTAREWNEWERKAKEKKIRYWLAETALDGLQNFLYWPIERLSDLRHYIQNRWIHPTHQLSSKLKKGQWHEFETRMLHCLFDELVDFVEIEQAKDVQRFSDDENKKYNTFLNRALDSIGLWRCPEAGLAYLTWAANLKQDEEWGVAKESPTFGQPTQQALVAQETIVLYKWWKEERSKRPDPMDASGLTAYYEERCREQPEQEHAFLYFDENESVESQEQGRKLSDLCHKMEQEQEDEDTEMLIRLVKIRRGLWT